MPARLWLPSWRDQHTYFCGTTICLDNKGKCHNWQTSLLSPLSPFLQISRWKLHCRLQSYYYSPEEHIAKEKLHMQIIPCWFFYLNWGWNGDSIHFICTIFNNHLSKVGFYGVFFFFFFSFLLNTCRKKEQVQFDSSTTTCAQNTDKKYRVKLK